MGAPPIVWSGNYAKLLKDQLQLSDSGSVLTGSADPSVTATDAPAGSIYLRDNGNLYVKQDDGNTANWGAVNLADRITVFPTNDQFSYGVQQFDDLNDAYASIPRGTGTIEQAANNWVVLAPGKTYTPASTILKIRASGTSGNTYVEDFGYSGQNAVGATITGTGIPANTTITAIAVVSSKMRATLSNALTQTITNELLNVDLPMQVIGITTDTLTSVTGVNYVHTGMIGASITGPGIPNGTTVAGVSYTSANSTITLSQAATASATVTLTLPTLADKFYCDLTRKGITTIFMGPASLGSFPGGSSWAPNAGVDPYTDFEVQLPVMANVSSIRSAFHIVSENNHMVGKDSHDVYRNVMLSGSLKFLDNGTTNGSSSTLASIANTIIWGNDGGKSLQNGTTTSGSDSITGLTSTARLSVGQNITGTGIPSNTYIKSITSGTAITMTRNATASGTVAITASSKGVEADTISAGNLFLSLYNTRIRSLCGQAVNRSSFAIYNTVELVYAKSCRFERTVAVNRWSHIADSVIAQGLLWQNNTQNGENDGIYNCDLQTSGALFEGPSSALLKMDGATNYHFVTNGCLLGPNTTKKILDQPGTAFLVGGADKTVANTVTETTLVPTTVLGSATIAANGLSKYQTVRVKMRGYYSTHSTAGTLDLKLKAGSTVIASSGALTMTNSITNLRWSLEIDLNCRSIGSSGTVIANGKAELDQAAFAAAFIAPIFNTAAQTLDTTASQALSVTATWGTANASNTITCTHCTLEYIS